MEISRSHPPGGGPASRTRAITALILWALLVLALSVIMIPQVGPKPFKASDKLAHAAFYAPLGALWVWAFGGGRRKKLLVLAGAAFALTFGVALEFVQAVLPWRSFELWDMAADLAGGSAGAVLAAFAPGFGHWTPLPGKRRKGEERRGEGPSEVSD